MHATLDDLVIALYVFVDDLLHPRPRCGRPARISDAELVALAAAQVLLDCPSERRWLRLVRKRLGHLFPYIPHQPGYNKRLRGLGPSIRQVLQALVEVCPSVCDRLRLLDSTPIPCAASRETVRRSELAGYAAYGYCACHSRYFWGFRLYILTTPDGLPVDFCLAPANEPEREVAAAMLERRPLLPGQALIVDKGFSGADFEALVAAMGAKLLRPDRRDEPVRHGNLGGIRQWVESIIDTVKGQLCLERHGGRTLEGVFTRVVQRLLALAAGIWFNWQLGTPGRQLTSYDH